MTHEATQAKKLGIGIAVPLGVLLLCLGGCVIYLMFDRRTRKRAVQNFRKGDDQLQNPMDSAMGNRNPPPRPVVPTGETDKATVSTLV